MPVREGGEREGTHREGDEEEGDKVAGDQSTLGPKRIPTPGADVPTDLFDAPDQYPIEF